MRRTCPRIRIRCPGRVPGAVKCAWNAFGLRRSRAFAFEPPRVQAGRSSPSRRTQAKRLRPSRMRVQVGRSNPSRRAQTVSVQAAFGLRPIRAWAAPNLAFKLCAWNAFELRPTAPGVARKRLARFRGPEWPTLMGRAAAVCRRGYRRRRICLCASRRQAGREFGLANSGRPI